MIKLSRLLIQYEQVDFSILIICKFRWNISINALNYMIFLFLSVRPREMLKFIGMFSVSRYLILILMSYLKPLDYTIYMQPCCIRSCRKCRGPGSRKRLLVRSGQWNCTWCKVKVTPKSRVTLPSMVIIDVVF